MLLPILLSTLIFSISSASQAVNQPPKFQVFTPDRLTIQVPRYEGLQVVTVRIGVQRPGADLEDLERGQNFNLVEDNMFVFDDRLDLHKGDVVNYLIAFKGDRGYEAQTGNYVFDGEYLNKKSQGSRIKRSWNNGYNYAWPQKYDDSSFGSNWNSGHHGHGHNSWASQTFNNNNNNHWNKFGHNFEHQPGSLEWGFNNLPKTPDNPFIPNFHHKHNSNCHHSHEDNNNDSGSHEDGRGIRKNDNDNVDVVKSTTERPSTAIITTTEPDVEVLTSKIMTTSTQFPDIDIRFSKD